ncbi:MAG: hypothetical protein QN193_10685 [Armatimonadota bacterium]|nr:hypothetical protein [Armatimonadota bacterium]MDR7443880.1 hypothetical protein [Armatimonadota bacterium]MDR7571061.1 hypothetical protein [Armatimonadota bacterium]MDR7615478.1 hypothetical protein [Armatimonadota bacterium]
MNRRLERLLSCFLDEEVTPQERAEVERLLRTDPEARAFLEDLRRVREALRALPDRPLPGDLTADLLQAVRGAGRIRGWTGQVPAIRGLFANALTRFVLAAACLAAVALLGAVPLLRPGPEGILDAKAEVEFLVREHALQVSADPLVDRAYLGITLTDAHLSLAGERLPEEGR